MTPYFRLMAEKEASDIFFCVDTVPRIKINGVIRAIGNNKLTSSDVREMAYSLINKEQAVEFEKTLEITFSLSLTKIGRFRINIFHQRGDCSIVIRYIKNKIPSFEEMNLPPILGDIVMEKRGLILAVGATGSGKSTTLAAMIDHRNRNSSSHILTIEDPLEYVHKHERSIVQQREVGFDTLSYQNALKNVLGGAPDVILIGEIRDMETMKHVINYAGTGHLCLATLHSNNANRALERIINFFPETFQRQLLVDLSLNLRAIVSQRLLPTVDGHSRVPAVEIMLNTPYISDLIINGKISDIKDAMKESIEPGMMTFDEALIKLYEDGKITLEEALQNADSRNDLSLAIRLGKRALTDDEPNDKLIFH